MLNEVKRRHADDRGGRTLERPLADTKIACGSRDLQRFGKPLPNPPFERRHRRVCPGEQRRHGERRLGRGVAYQQVPRGEVGQARAVLLHDRQCQIDVGKGGTGGCDPSILSEDSSLVHKDRGILAAK